MSVTDRVHGCRLMLWAEHNTLTITALSGWGILNAIVTMVKC